MLCAIPVLCMHCETAMCDLVCPTGAIYRELTTGAIKVNPDRCIGCSACAYACPFGAISLDIRTRTGVVCDLCNGEPLCVRTCPTGALEFIAEDEMSAKLKRGKAARFADLLTSAERLAG